jgi:hypothetical protein
MALQGVSKAFAVSVVAILAGCASDNASQGGDPGARPLPAGQSCQSVRAELDRLDRRGVPSKVEAANSGRKLSGADRADVDRYNALLSQYLGARCHL